MCLYSHLYFECLLYKINTITYASSVLCASAKTHITHKLYASQQNINGDMIVDYVSPVTATLLVYYFATNTAFSFADPFRTAGTVVGSPAFVENLQYQLLLNLAAQIGPEIVCDFVCIVIERLYGFDELLDEYWDEVFSFAGFTRKYGPGCAIIVMVNLAIVLLTGKSACLHGECVSGFTR